MLGDVEVDAVQDPAVTVTLDQASPKEPGRSQSPCLVAARRVAQSARRRTAPPSGRTTARNDVGREVVTRGHLDLRSPYRIHRTENRDQSAILLRRNEIVEQRGRDPSRRLRRTTSRMVFRWFSPRDFAAESCEGCTDSMPARNTSAT